MIEYFTQVFDTVAYANAQVTLLLVIQMSQWFTSFYQVDSMLDSWCFIVNVWFPSLIVIVWFRALNCKIPMIVLWNSCHYIVWYCHCSYIVELLYKRHCSIVDCVPEFYNRQWRFLVIYWSNSLLLLYLLITVINYFNTNIKWALNIYLVYKNIFIHKIIIYRSE